MTQTEVKINVRPLRDNVVVDFKSEESDRTPGGILLPDTAKEKPQIGKVLAVGPGRTEDGKLIEMTVKVGDKVLYARYGGTEIKIDGKDVKILSEKDILAIVQ